MQGASQTLPRLLQSSLIRRSKSVSNEKKNIALSRGRRAYHSQHWPVISRHSESGPWPREGHSRETPFTKSPQRLPPHPVALHHAL